MKIFQVLFTVLVICLFSCADNPNSKLIVGRWDGVTWLVNGDSSQFRGRDAYFDFDDKGKYKFTYGKDIQEGTYKVENDMLFTRPEGGLEIMVKINRLTNDTLVFDMNRSGQAEMLTLRRDK